MNFTISHLSVIGHKMKVIIGLWILISEQPYKSSFLTTSHILHDLLVSLVNPLANLFDVLTLFMCKKLHYWH